MPVDRFDSAVLSRTASQAVLDIRAAKSEADLEAIRLRLLGKKGWIKALEQQLREVPPEARREFGRGIHLAKTDITAAIEEQEQSLKSAQDGPGRGAIDVTLPGIRPLPGGRHPIMSTMDEVKLILLGLGFRYDDYPELETEFFNFDALNTPDWHPVRDTHDSFFTVTGNVMRTHTSAFQARAMRQFGPPPLRAMTSGRCYRRDAVDASHFPIFHQLDAIAIDRTISFSNLKWTLLELAEGLFGSGAKLRFRPSYFAFTTPSAEVDVWFEGRWLEILGAGMIRPEVLKAGGVSPEEWQGFAFGLGIDRIAMTRHGITDIRLLYENRESFLRQF